MPCVLIRQMMVWCASSWFSHPGSAILAPQLKVSKFPGAGMLEGQNLYLLNLVPRILLQTCCSSLSHITESALTEIMSKEWWSTDIIFRCYRHTMKYTDDILSSCILVTCVNLLANVTLIKLIKINDKKSKSCYITYPLLKEFW